MFCEQKTLCYYYYYYCYSLPQESESVHLRETLDLQAKCTKQEKDLERLREHLLQVEEHYTGEAVMNKEQEGQLREQLRLMESELGRINEQLNQQRFA